MHIVAVYGGSFNPPHKGHFETVNIIKDEVRPDGVMMLFSKNIFKPESEYAPIKHRIAMARILADAFSVPGITFSDYEDRLGYSSTYHVLKSLQKDYPDTRFIWTMGADNLAVFHTWNNWENIINEFPVFVINRVGFREQALSSPAALKYAAMKTEPGLLRGAANGWAFCETLPPDESSHLIRSDLKSGKQAFGNDTDIIMPYITENSLYR